MVPLSRVEGLTPALADRLRAAWIDTAEQLAAISVQPSGVGTIAEHLGISPSQARQIVDAAWRILPSDIASELRGSASTQQFGLGAIKPTDDQD